MQILPCEHKCRTRELEHLASERNVLGSNPDFVGCDLNHDGFAERVVAADMMSSAPPLVHDQPKANHGWVSQYNLY